jgi:hypothetical protein
MPTVSPKERLFDCGVSGKFGTPYLLGEKMLGYGYLGQQEIQIVLCGLDFDESGILLLGADDVRWGVYQKRHGKHFSYYVREKFMVPRNPRTEIQQAWRNVFASGMEAWGDLTESERKLYNERGHRLKLHGVNLFLREWLNSH